MIRLSLTARPEAWHEIEIVMDGEASPMRVKYWLLKTREAAEWTAERLKLARAVKGGDDGETFDRLLDELSPEKLAQIRDLLMDRIIDWDLQDADADPPAKLPITVETLGAILDLGAFWRPLFQGLIDASSGLAAKKTA